MGFDIETLKSIGSKIMDVAPALAGAVLAPNPATVLLALASIKRAVGLNPDAPEAEIDAALVGNPEMRLKLLVEEQGFRLEMRKQENASLALQLADVQDARKKAVEETKVTGRRDYNIYTIAYFILGGFLVMVGALLYWNVYLGKAIQDDSGILFMLMGQLATMAIAVLSYYFGSTQQSLRKTGIIAQSDAVKNGK